jgi:hypothetical protein
MEGWGFAQFAGSARRFRAIITCLIGLLLVFLTGYAAQIVELVSAPIFKSALGVLNDFIREVGFALVVAVIIWTVFEYFARAENDAMWKERTEELSENIFYGLHRRRLPRAYFNLANEVVLSPVFVRTGWQIHYLLRDANDVPFVIVSCTTRYEITNITDEIQAFPLQISLPNPMHSSMKDKVGVSSLLLWQSGKRQEPDLREAQRAFRDQIQGDSAQVPFSAGSVEILPQDKVEVAFTFTLVKYPSDSEILRGPYPSDSLQVFIVDHGPSKRQLGGHSIHPDPLERVSPTGSGDAYQFRINRYLLPHHGVVIFWKAM